MLKIFLLFMSDNFCDKNALLFTLLIFFSNDVTILNMKHEFISCEGQSVMKFMLVDVVHVILMY